MSKVFAAQVRWPEFECPAPTPQNPGVVALVYNSRSGVWGIRAETGEFHVASQSSQNNQMNPRFNERHSLKKKERKKDNRGIDKEPINDF